MLIPRSPPGNEGAASGAPVGDVATTPLFSGDVLRATTQLAVAQQEDNILRQYGLLAGIRETYNQEAKAPVTKEDAQDEPQDNRLFLNTNAPWSAFICGSQGSGKSYTLSCMLEAALVPSKAAMRLGKLPNPLAGLVFHFDKFTGSSTTQVCEAAYLSSIGVPVKILVSLASYAKMRQVYTNLPGVPRDRQPIVQPMLFEQRHLNANRMKKLMAVESTEGSMPLYMEVRFLVNTAISPEQAVSTS